MKRKVILTYDQLAIPVSVIESKLTDGSPVWDVEIGTPEEMVNVSAVSKKAAIACAKQICTALLTAWNGESEYMGRAL